MKIKYELNLEDFFVFSDYLIKTSPLMRKTIRKGQMWWASGPLIAGLMLSIFRGYPPEKALTTLAVLSFSISLPMFLMYKNYFRYRNKKQIKALSEEDRYKEILGTHKMTISENYLIEQTPENENKVPWDSIDRIETISDHTFIFTDEVTAYIIPHKKMTSGDTSQFMD